MKTYIDYRSVESYGWYDVRVDKDGQTNVTCGLIPAEQLGMYLESYLDMDDNEVYIRFEGMPTFMEVPKSWGVRG